MICKIGLICKTLLFPLMLLTGLSCSTLVNKTLDGEKYYKRDIKIIVNGETFIGYGVPKKASSYKIKLIAKGKIDEVVFTTCHRNPSFLNKKRGCFRKKNTFEYIYIPDPGIEDKPGCYLEIGTRDILIGKHGFGTLDFHTGETLDAEIKCDGTTRHRKGVSICESRSGLMQQISFKQRVKYSVDQKSCGYFMTDDDKTFQYILNEGECIVNFMSKDRQVHRHSMFGTNDTLLRSDL